MNSFLEKIPGQLRVKQILQNFLYSDAIPHAFLFTGMDGVGKENAAIQFAKTLISIKIKNGKIEPALNSIDRLQEPFIKFVIPLPRGRNETESNSPTEKLSEEDLELIREEIEEKSKNPFHKISIHKANNIKINSIRDIKKFLSMNYDETPLRFVIISDADRMNEEAQNALLKSLEEPPGNVIFILTTAAISKLRTTIISRCWKINFDPLPDIDVVKILVEYFEIDKSTAEEVASFAMGSVQTALNLIKYDFSNLKEKTISILRYSFGRKFNSAFDELNSILTSQNQNDYQIIIGMMCTWLNDIQRNKLNIENVFYSDYVDTLEKFNNKFPGVDLNGITSKLERLSNFTRNNINPNLLSANLIFELSAVVLENK